MFQTCDLRESGKAKSAVWISSFTLGVTDLLGLKTRPEQLQQQRHTSTSPPTEIAKKKTHMATMSPGNNESSVMLDQMTRLAYSLIQAMSLRHRCTGDALSLTQSHANCLLPPLPLPSYPFCSSLLAAISYTSNHALSSS